MPFFVSGSGSGHVYTLFPSVPFLSPLSPLSFAASSNLMAVYENNGTNVIRMTTGSDSGRLGEQNIHTQTYNNSILKDKEAEQLKRVC